MGYLLLFSASSLLFLNAACTVQPQPQGSPQPEFNLTGTVRDIMHGIVGPASDVVFHAVATTVDEKGTAKKFPRTDEEWDNVRNNALMLLEASNLLLIPGRSVAKAGENVKDPDVYMGPDRIQTMIDRDRATWNKLAQGMHDAVIPALQAIEAKGADALLESTDRINLTCENCHLTYWYPRERRPQ